MNTPFFPAFRSRLAALGRRTVHSLRQATLGQLQDQIRDLLPATLLSCQKEGTNSPERDFPLRLTFECVLWQMLKLKTACREVVRQVQALRTLQGLPPISEGDSAYIQARLRLPRERLEKALASTAQTADLRVGQSSRLQGRPVKVVDGSSTRLFGPRTASNRRFFHPTNGIGCRPKSPCASSASPPRSGDFATAGSRW